MNLKSTVAKLKNIKSSEMAVKLFSEPTLKVLATLKAENRAVYEDLLATWKSGGFGRITALEQEVNKAGKAEQKQSAGPLGDAEQFRAEVMPHLVLFRDDWLCWKTSHYAEIEEKVIRGLMWKFLARRKSVPKKRDVSDVMDALAGICIVGKDKLEPPCWLDGRDGPDPREIISCANGLLHVPTRKMMSHTPMFFTRTALEVEYSARAAKPRKWLKRCKEIWPDDPDQEALLQELFGYLLLPDIRLHRVFMLWGIPRGGKTATANVMAKFIGRRNIASPKLEHLGAQFGLENLLGKTLMMVTDMRLGKSADRHTIVSHILRLSGGDPVDVDRKYKSALTGILPIRFLLIGNVMPVLPDETGALKKRMEFLAFNRSFAGDENRDIESAFDDELPGLLGWALDGWDRLQKQGDFTKSETSAKRRDHMENLSSRTRPFIDECCDLDPEAVTPKRDLWRAFQRYAEHNDVTRYSTAAMFHEDLHMGADYAIENADKGKSWKGIALKHAPQRYGPCTEDDDGPWADGARNHGYICRECGKTSINQ